MDKKKIEKIKKLAEDFLTEINQKGEVVVAESRENSQKEKSVLVQIKTEEPGVLIGFHGKTLAAFQTLLGQMVYKSLGEWVRVVVDVNDYRQEQKERLKAIALNAVQKAKFSNQSVALPPMTPYERRIIHLVLSEFPEVEESSEGEGDSRHIVIRPKG